MLTVQQYISTVFHSTSPNISINGLPPTPQMLDSMLTNSTYGNASIEEYEAFDPRLWEKAKDLARQEEDLIEEIAALRRKMPGVAVENVKLAYKGGVEDDERVLGGFVERVRERVREEAGLGVAGLERQGDVEGAWRRGVEGLESLKSNLPEMVAKAERARKAEAYVLEGEKR
jgi:kinetochor protein Mis14/NSL1